jgi:hypothetical protein
MLEAQNFFTLIDHATFYIMLLSIYMVITIFTVNDYTKQCKLLMGDDFHFSDCLYDDAVTRTMVTFSLLPCVIFAIYILVKFTGEKQSWLSIVKMVNHFVIVVCLISTEHGLIKSLLKVEETNNNMMCVVVDMIILIVVDIPDLPYPFDFTMLSMDICYICYKL